MAALPFVQLMSRRQCCLCDDAKAVLEQAAASALCTWETVNVDCDKALLVRYGNDVPVILIDGEKHFEHRVTLDELSKALEGVTC